MSRSPMATWTSMWLRKRSWSRSSSLGHEPSGGCRRPTTGIQISADGLGGSRGEVEHLGQSAEQPAVLVRHALPERNPEGETFDELDGVAAQLDIRHLLIVALTNGDGGTSVHHER